MNKIITITRQFGSGGREIGKKLAEAYGIPFYDNEIISRAAKDTGFAEAAFERASKQQSALFHCDGNECIFQSGCRIFRFVVR